MVVPLLLKCLTVEGGQWGELGQHGNAAKRFQGGGVIAVVRSIQDQSKHRKIAVSEGFQAQQGVVQRSEAAASHKNNGYVPMLQLVDL